MAFAVNVSVEVAAEHQIQEITYDGQEIYQQPLSMSENLTKLAHKIDFGKDDKEEQVASEGPVEDEKSDESKDASQLATRPWDSVRNKLKNALTEVCVLSDVLSITKQKHYMVLDPISQEAPDSRPIAQLLAKKKALQSAAQVLQVGAERLRTTQVEMNRTKPYADFHLELLRLRQHWRLKKLGNTIVGDLSYRTAGSRFWQGGTFEVSKSEESPVIPPDPVPTPSPRPYGALKVTIPSELEGISYIQVTIQKDQGTLCSARLTIPNPPPTHTGADTHWHQRLEAAQNVLFCKELFSQLAREAVQLEDPIPHMVVGNQITASLFPGIQLIIGLCHSSVQDKKTPSPPQKAEHNHVLEHSLHQLLREAHHRNIHHPMPHPTTATLGVSKKRRLAGPDAYDRHTLIKMVNLETLLEQIIRQAQHVVLRLRTMYVIDTLAKEFKDPLIMAHWNCLNNPTQSCVKVNIMTHGYETICRTALVVHVGHKTLKAICREGRVVHMSYEPQELRDLILCKIAQHQVNAVLSLSKLMSWQILSSSSHSGVGTVEPLGNAFTVSLASPNGDRVIALRYGAQTGVQVLVQSSPRKDFYPSQLVKDLRWENLGGNFREVRWDRMEGRSFVNKMELLMSSLTTG